MQLKYDCCPLERRFRVWRNLLKLHRFDAEFNEKTVFVKSWMINKVGEKKSHASNAS